MRKRSIISTTFFITKDQGHQGPCYAKGLKHLPIHLSTRKSRFPPHLTLPHFPGRRADSPLPFLELPHFPDRRADSTLSLSFPTFPAEEPIPPSPCASPHSRKKSRFPPHLTLPHFPCRRADSPLSSRFPTFPAEVQIPPSSSFPTFPAEEPIPPSPRDSPLSLQKSRFPPLLALPHIPGRRAYSPLTSSFPTFPAEEPIPHSPCAFPFSSRFKSSFEKRPR
jgi:hypothetical protein